MEQHVIAQHVARTNCDGNVIFYIPIGIVIGTTTTSIGIIPYFNLWPYANMEHIIYPGTGGAKERARFSQMDLIWTAHSYHCCNNSEGSSTLHRNRATHCDTKHAIPIILTDNGTRNADSDPFMDQHLASE